MTLLPFMTSVVVPRRVRPSDEYAERRSVSLHGDRVPIQDLPPAKITRGSSREELLTRSFPSGSAFATKSDPAKMGLGIKVVLANFRHDDAVRCSAVRLKSSAIGPYKRRGSIGRASAFK